MARKAKQLRSDMGWSTRDRIGVRGLDLCVDIIGKLNLGDFAFLEIKGRVPTPAVLAFLGVGYGVRSLIVG